MTEDKKWRDRAACIGELDLFFSNDWRDWRKARDICMECPIRKMCLTDALENEDRFGVWGGVDQYEIRRALSIDEKGFPHKSRLPTRCPYCLTKDVTTLEKRRSRIHLQCSVCDFAWWSRRATAKKEVKSANVDRAVPAGSEEGGE